MVPEIMSLQWWSCFTLPRNHSHWVIIIIFLFHLFIYHTPRINVEMMQDPINIFVHFVYLLYTYYITRQVYIHTCTLPACHAKVQCATATGAGKQQKKISKHLISTQFCSWYTRCSRVLAQPLTGRHVFDKINVLLVLFVYFTFEVINYQVINYIL